MSYCPLLGIASVDLKDQGGVIRQRIGIAILLWPCTVATIFIGAFLRWT